MTGADTLTIELVSAQFTGLSVRELERWVALAWVRPDPAPDAAGLYLFRAIDIERVRLIVTLRDTMAVNDDALPVVLSLLDQLYDARRRLARLHAAIEAALPPDLRAAVAAHAEVLPSSDERPGDLGSGGIA